MERKPLTLYELNSLVRQAIELTLADEFWVEAELSEVREVRGHCYMELVQKDVFSNTPVARAQAKCWSRTWARLRPKFEHATGTSLRAGMKVLLRVRANFHEAYGFSWIVNDIDPTFTLGDLARRRQEIIAQLKAEGVFDLQKELLLPLFCQRIAVISSANAAGYGDFCHQLEQNEYGFKFQVKLFPAIMQGEKVESTVIAALDDINAHAQAFDVVVIIRGGGATADMSGFDTLALAENVANFPLPIITGIGHERDESVLDMVSNTRVKTPTAAAAFLVEHLADVWNRIEDCQQTVVSHVENRMQVERLRLSSVSDKISVLFSLVKTRQEAQLKQLWQHMLHAKDMTMDQRRHQLDKLVNNLEPLTARRIAEEKHRLQLLSEQLKSLDPQLLLRRGYSITLKNGKAVRDASQLMEGDCLQTRLEKGIVWSVVGKHKQ